MEELRKRVRYLEGENGSENEAGFERSIGDLADHKKEVEIFVSCFLLASV